MAASASSSSSSSGSIPTTPEEIRAEYDRICHRKHPSEDFDIKRKRLGKGSFGSVYEGVELKTGLRVALKFSHHHLRAEAMAGARSEAVMMQHIMDKTNRQPNLAKFVGVYEFPNAHSKTGTTIVHVLMLWEGGSLLEKVMQLISQGVWNETYAAQAFSQLLYACKALHNADGTGSFVHCDIKLDNDFVEGRDRDAYAILGDFGEVRWVPKSDENPNSEVKLSRFVGTHTYAAPEQLIPDASGKHTYSPAADMWSMGVTLYCILNSSFPFPRDPGAELNRRVRKGQYYAFAAGVSEDAKDLIKKLLDVDPAKRLTAEQALAHPWVKRATEDDLAAARDALNLTTTGAKGELLPSPPPSGSAAASVVEGVRTAAVQMDSGEGKAKDLSRALHGGLSEEQFEIVMDKLEEVLGRSFDVYTAELTEAQFSEVMSKLQIKGLVIPRLFAALDADGSGSLSVKELTEGLAAITAPSESRARVVFKMYDADGDGEVSLTELTGVLRCCVTDDERLETVKAEQLVRALAEMDEAGTGKVTLEQFIGAVRKNPFLAKLMLQPNEHFKRFVSTAAGAAGDAAEPGSPWDVTVVRAALDEAADASSSSSSA